MRLLVSGGERGCGADDVVLETLFYGVPYAVLQIAALVVVALAVAYWQLPRIYDLVTSTDRKRT